MGGVGEIWWRKGERFVSRPFVWLVAVFSFSFSFSFLASQNLFFCRFVIDVPAVQTFPHVVGSCLHFRFILKLFFFRCHPPNMFVFLPVVCGTFNRHFR